MESKIRGEYKPKAANEKKLKTFLKKIENGKQYNRMGSRVGK